MLKLLGAIIDRIFVLFGGLLFMQFPIFMKQYQNQLVARIAELQLQVDKISQAALQSGKNAQQFIQKFIASPDKDIAAQGQIMENMVSRLHELSHSLADLTHASVITRPFIFLQNLNGDITQSTLQSYEPGLVFTYEGVVYIFIGMLFGYLIFWFFKNLFLLIFLIEPKTINHRRF